MPGDGSGLLDIRGRPYPPESGGSLVRHVLRRTSGVVPQGRVQAAPASTRGRPLQQCVFDGFEHAFQILANQAVLESEDPHVKPCKEEITGLRFPFIA